MIVRHNKNYSVPLFCLLSALFLYFVDFTDGKPCIIEEDCESNECCVALSVFQVPQKGICVELSMEGQYCNDRQAQLKYFGGKYILQCPCQEGMACLLQESTSNRSGDDALPTLLDQRCQTFQSLTLDKTLVKEIQLQNDNTGEKSHTLPAASNKNKQSTINLSSSHSKGTEHEIKESYEHINKATSSYSSFDNEISESTTDSLLINETTVDGMEIHFEADGAQKMEKESHGEILYRELFSTISQDDEIHETSTDAFSTIESFTANTGISVATNGTREKKNREGKYMAKSLEILL
ncbi:hypothetical protein HNY73_003143 [Argiope bruennichi]|uniref:Prokineticin domain-containing protein n=1 Tax=Argiope bruennichi TaxID=94029 RepID=A0A8T0FX18_ARGBR|nr:hypothetical protein HNY73_003143 [Argiope bruennichi]